MNIDNKELDNIELVSLKPRSKIVSEYEKERTQAIDNTEASRLQDNFNYYLTSRQNNTSEYDLINTETLKKDLMASSNKPATIVLKGNHEQKNDDYMDTSLKITDVLGL